MKQVAIECNNISKAFGSVEALRGVSITAVAGEVTAIVGDNGAGSRLSSSVFLVFIQRTVVR